MALEDAHTHLPILKLMKNLGICGAICHVLSEIALTYLIVKVWSYDNVSVKY
jgi:hypothetical protein